MKKIISVLFIFMASVLALCMLTILPFLFKSAQTAFETPSGYTLGYFTGVLLASGSTAALAVFLCYKGIRLWAV